MLKMEAEESNLIKPKKESGFQMISKVEEETASKDRLIKQCAIFDEQERVIQVVQLQKYFERKLCSNLLYSFCFFDRN